MTTKPEPMGPRTTDDRAKLETVIGCIDDRSITDGEFRNYCRMFSGSLRAAHGRWLKKVGRTMDNDKEKGDEQPMGSMDQG